jgi:sulfide:quinone oxidoreductase
MKPRILVLGAGFGGLALSTLLSESLGDTVEVTVIDKSDYFIFGFSKLDLLFGHADARGMRLPLSSNSPTGSTVTASLTAISTRGLIRICPGLASSQSREASSRLP